MKTVQIKDITVGGGKGLFVLAGPCVIDLMLLIAFNYQVVQGLNLVVTVNLYQIWHVRLWLVV